MFAVVAGPKLDIEESHRPMYHEMVASRKLFPEEDFSGEEMDVDANLCCPDAMSAILSTVFCPCWLCSLKMFHCQSRPFVCPFMCFVILGFVLKIIESQSTARHNVGRFWEG